MSSKTKFEVEFSFTSSPQILYQYISTASGLSEWFADNVIYRGDIFTFQWEDSEERAKMISKRTGERVRFKWLDEKNQETEYYFELKIIVDEITKDVSLLVTDFAFENEIDESKQLWENQISDLKHLIGSV